MKILTCALLLMPAVLFAAQGEKEKWQRVYTGEDSIIEINLSRVTFVEYNVSRKVTFGYSIGRVGFRTILSKPEALKEKPAVKYKSRLETIEFNCAANTTRYRLYEATLLDEKGKVIKTLGWDPSAEWKEIKHGGMMDKLSGAACTLIDEKRRNQ
ncbi:MAG TPA: surface-adhesin E family protein [Pyrinomonadaceae bacterium]|nr:surface-adhesin E family protein [Pyrinomonadaceae bacterium]